MLLAVYLLINDPPETHHWVRASKMTGRSIFPVSVCSSLYLTRMKKTLDATPNDGPMD